MGAPTEGHHTGGTRLAAGQATRPPKPHHGRGGVIGTIIGALIVAVLRNGLTAMNIDSNYQNLATGVLVILAVAFDQLTRRRSS